jgi:hypothetical protein
MIQTIKAKVHASPQLEMVSYSDEKVCHADLNGAMNITKAISGLVA